MNILMMSNTYTPIVGGLERSVQTFTEEYRRRGHRVIIVAPTFEGMPSDENDVIRVPAVQHFNHTDFSVQLPIPGFLQEALKNFRPDVIHAHHPFLIGDTALRVAYQFNAPLVYTYHTLFEYNTHYVPGDSPVLKRFTRQLSVGYANLADQVFAPSQGIRAMLEAQGVRSPIAVVPTGLDLSRFSKESSIKSRDVLGIPRDAYLVGYVGRLAPEKNLDFLSRAVLSFLKKRSDAYFLVVGKGPSERTIRDIFGSQSMQDRVFFTGALEGDTLIEAYHAMNVFAFASKSETQGMSLVEAMAAGVPVVALDALGIHGLIENRVNGILINREDEIEFARALNYLANLPAGERKVIGNAARATASCYSKEACAELALSFYAPLTRIVLGRRDRGSVWGDRVWSKKLRQLRADWELVKNVTKAASTAMKGGTHVP